jgi:NAD(P)-dependent dehydrogenase (short-subunit alcohol dehydrogenase family)
MELIFVSGASSGIGAALAAQLSQLDDVSVATFSRSEVRASHHLAVDLSEPSQWQLVSEWMRAVADEVRPSAVFFFHCAATLDPIGFAGEVDSDAYASNVVLNSASPQVLGDRFVALAKQLEVPAVMVQISSGAATKAYPGWSSYCAAKAAVDHWTRTVGVELDQRGDPITVISVAPGVVETPMQAGIREVDEADFPNVQRFRDLESEGILRSPEEVARDLWSLATRTNLENGAVLDLRDSSR